MTPASPKTHSSEAKRTARYVKSGCLDALFSAAVKRVLTAQPKCGTSYRTGLMAWETTERSMRQDTGGGEETVEEESLASRFHHLLSKDTFNSSKVTVKDI